jgi:hypothetical protein
LTWPGSAQLDSVRQNERFGLRGMRRNPRTTAALDLPRLVASWLDEEG